MAAGIRRELKPGGPHDFRVHRLIAHSRHLFPK
jgi:hypothetical protein